jgi:hypothetical protein
MPEDEKKKYTGEERRRPPMNGEIREVWIGPDGEERRMEFRESYEKYKRLHHHHHSKPGAEKEKAEPKSHKEPKKKSFWNTPL